MNWNERITAIAFAEGVAKKSTRFVRQFSEFYDEMDAGA